MNFRSCVGSFIQLIQLLFITDWGLEGTFISKNPAHWPSPCLDQQSVFLCTPPGTTRDRGARPRSPCFLSDHHHDGDNDRDGDGCKITTMMISLTVACPRNPSSFSHQRSRSKIIFRSSRWDFGQLATMDCIHRQHLPSGRKDRRPRFAAAAYIQSPPLLPVHPGGHPPRPAGHLQPHPAITNYPKLTICIIKPP